MTTNPSSVSGEEAKPRRLDPAPAAAPARPTLPAGVTTPIPRALVGLALPVLASQMLRLGYQWVDALWVRGLGVYATGARRCS